MADEKIFVSGMIFKAPHERAPEFVRGSISIKVEELIPFLEAHAKPDGWVNIVVKESRGGKLYCELDQWARDAAPKAEARKVDDINPDDIPF